MESLPSNLSIPPLEASSLPPTPPDSPTKEDKIKIISEQALSKSDSSQELQQAKGRINKGISTHLQKTSEKADSVSTELRRGSVGSPTSVSQNLEEQMSEEGGANRDFPFEKIDELAPPPQSLISSRDMLNRLSHEKPLLPLPVATGNLNAVYITQFKNSEVNNVVCKVDINAALRNVLCFHLGKLTHLESVLVPTTMGRATVVLPKDPQAEYEILRTSSNQRILIHGEDKTSPLGNIKKEEDGSLTGMMDGLKLRLLPQEDGSYNVKVIPKRMDECLKTCDGFTLMTDDENVDSLEEAFSVGLVPNNQIFSVIEGKNNQEYVKIDGIIYLIKSELNESEDEIITLDSVPIKGGQTQAKRPEIIRQQFARVYQEDSEGDMCEFLVPKNAYFDCAPSEDGEIRFSSEGNKYIAKQNDQGGFSITPSANKRKSESIPFDFNSDSFVLAHDPKTKQSFLVPASESSVISQDEQGKDVVFRYDQKFQLETTKNGIQLLGRNVVCMVQEKVENVVTQSSGNLKPLNLLRISPERQEFLEKIDSSDFIKCWLAIMLLRPQDCKVSDLTESNVLFTQEGKHLKMSLIDLDETLPPANDRSHDDELTKGGTENVHPIRNGLMAFPQANRPLDNNQKALVIDLMKGVISARGDIESFLSGFAQNLDEVLDKKHLNEAHIQSTLDVIDKMELFLESKTEHDEWTLQDLFFTVFPEYKQQWDELSNAGFSNEDKALSLGNVSVKALIEAERDRAQRIRK